MCSSPFVNAILPLREAALLGEGSLWNQGALRLLSFSSNCGMDTEVNSEQREKLTPSGDRRRWRLAFVVFGIDHDVTLGGFAVTLGAQVREVTQRQVDDATLAR